MSVYGNRIQSLRNAMKKHGLDGYVVPVTDEYQNEYPPETFHRLAWLTGFTGSSGYALILLDKAAASTNSIYTLQIDTQVDHDLYQRSDYIEQPLPQWFIQNASQGAVIGFDPKLTTPHEVTNFKDAFEYSDKKLTFQSVEQNLIDLVWTQERPEFPCAPITIFPEQTAGRSAEDKRTTLAAQLRYKDCSASIITSLDSIAWLLNVRGGDTACTPLILSCAILNDDGSVDWFVDDKKLSAEINAHLGENVRTHAPNAFDQILANVAEAAKSAGKTILFDAKRSSQYYLEHIQKHGVGILNGDDLCIHPKAIKTQAEQDAMRCAHIRDGAAIVKFLKWLDDNVASETLTELDVDQKLIDLRSSYPEFRDVSFPTISGYAGNGAIVHYRVTPQTNQTILNKGLLLVDSGGQYIDGTTDITRTIAVGDTTQEMKENYTRVLIGHLMVAMAEFAPGTTGKPLDELARSALVEVGLNYGHGTGHGVGCYLGVHEEAAPISPRGETPFEAGMISSNEPGYYKMDEYGIRIETLVLTIEKGQGLAFETITIAPYERRLIVTEMLNTEQIAWLDAYHADMMEKLTPYLDDSEEKWLQSFAQPL